GGLGQAAPARGRPHPLLCARDRLNRPYAVEAFGRREPAWGSGAAVTRRRAAFFVARTALRDHTAPIARCRFERKPFRACLILTYSRKSNYFDLTVTHCRVELGSRPLTAMEDKITRFDNH